MWWCTAPHPHSETWAHAQLLSRYCTRCVPRGCWALLAADGANGISVDEQEFPCRYSWAVRTPSFCSCCYNSQKSFTEVIRLLIHLYSAIVPQL